jgi:hypothetical protein
MNELNLQHPGFRARIINVRMDYSQLIVEYVMYRKYFTPKIFQLIISNIGLTRLGKRLIRLGNLTK